MVEYRYDAWGKPLSKTGSMAATLGTYNPFRYRHYVYDEETGVYYLRSRYYNPVWGRFLNADDVAYLNADGDLLSCNLFAYCSNNPVSRSDPDGCIDYSTINSGVDLFSLVHSQELIYGYADDYLAEQYRIIKKGVPYKHRGQSDRVGYDCATFHSKALQVCSTSDEHPFIRSETGTDSMLKNKGDLLLFIARVGDYSLDEIPLGAYFVRTAGYNGHSSGHGASFAGRLYGNQLRIYHASSEGRGILADVITYDVLCKNYEYILWPRYLGTTEQKRTVFHNPNGHLMK